MDVMCLLHDQEEYGVMRWSLAEIAQAIGCQKSKLQTLVIKNVLKGSDTGLCESLVYIPRSGRKNGAPITVIQAQKAPIWYSSRMVIDEYKRMLRGGEIAAPNPAPDYSPKGGIGEGIDATPKVAPNPAPDYSPSHACAPRADPSSSSSTTCKTINQSNAGVRDSNLKFAMTPDWRPSDHVADLARQSGTVLLPADLPDMVAHWLTEPDTRRTQAEWDKALLQTAKHRKLRADSVPSSQPRSGKPQTENFASKNYGEGVSAL